MRDKDMQDIFTILSWVIFTIGVVLVGVVLWGVIALWMAT